MNNNIVNVLKAWISNFDDNSFSTWIINNQMWIFPVDSNYVVYGHVIDDTTDVCCEIYVANIDLSISFKNIIAVRKFINNPVITIQ